MLDYNNIVSGADLKDAATRLGDYTAHQHPGSDHWTQAA
jgi:hypothetical protein